MAKSYTNKAVFVLVLYLFFWLPGVIANFIYYREAKRDQQGTLKPIPGVGALRIELALLAWLPLGIGGAYAVYLMLQLLSWR